MLKRYWPALVGLVYLLYRLSFTAEGANWFLFVVVFLAELFGLLRFMTVMSLTGRRVGVDSSPTTEPSPDASVLVVISDEPGSEARSAVLAARLVRHKNDLVVVDRDGRLDVMQMCDRLGVRRVAGDGEQDLASLVNQAMGFASTHYWLIVPGDVVVLPDVLEVTVPAMADEHVAVVRPRVERTNARSSEGYGGYGQDWIRDEHMTAMFDASGADMPWWPGLCLVRRAALLESDGVAGTTSSGFTLETGARLQKLGWDVRDLPVVVGRRLAVHSDRRLLHRWARDLHEQLTLLERPDSPVTRDYVSGWRQRAYLNADFQLAASLQRIALLAVLATTAFTGLTPVGGSPVALSVLFVAWHASALTMRWQTFGKRFVPWFSTDLRLMATNVVVGTASRFGRPLRSDLLDDAPGEKQRRTLMTALPVVFGLGALVAGFSLFGVQRTGFQVSVTVVFCLIVAAAAIEARVALREEHGRRMYRASQKLEVRASLTTLAVTGVSPRGLDLVSPKHLVPGSKLRVSFALPRVDDDPIGMEVLTSVKRSWPAGDGYQAFAQFHLLDENQMDRVLEYVSVVAGAQALRSGDQFGQSVGSLALDASASEVAEDE